MKLTEDGGRHFACRELQMANRMSEGRGRKLGYLDIRVQDIRNQDISEFMVWHLVGGIEKITAENAD